MLEVKCLYRPRDEIIASNESLLKLLVFFILLSNLIVFELVGVGRKVESEDCRGLLEQNTYIFLEIFDSQILIIFLQSCQFLFFYLGL